MITIPTTITISNYTNIEKLIFYTILRQNIDFGRQVIHARGRLGQH